MKQVKLLSLLCFLVGFSLVADAQADKLQLSGNIEFKHGTSQNKRTWAVMFQNALSNDEVVWVSEHYRNNGVVSPGKNKKLTIKKIFATSEGYPRIDRTTGVITLHLNQVDEYWGDNVRPIAVGGQGTLLVVSLTPHKKDDDGVYLYQMTAKFNYASDENGNVIWQDKVNKNDNFLVGKVGKR
jgi:hypothetical protein